MKSKMQAASPPGRFESVEEMIGDAFALLGPLGGFALRACSLAHLTAQICTVSVGLVLGRGPHRP